MRSFFVTYYTTCESLLSIVIGKFLAFGGALFYSRASKLKVMPLENISDIKPSFKHNNEKAYIIQKIDQLFTTADPRKYDPEERADIIYSGPAVFYCRDQYVEDIFKRFGALSKPLEKDARCRVIYPLEKAEFTPRTLYWLSTVPEYGIRVIGPREVVKVVQEYYLGVSRNITDTWLVRGRNMPAK